jgi:heterodisulfide reductase subunit C
MSEHIFNESPFLYDPAKREEEIIQALQKSGFEPNACIQCGTCTASCLSGRWTAMRTRAIMKRAALGDSTILADPDIWLCTTCYTCFDRCPRNLKVTDAILELRNLAVSRGLINPKHQKAIEILHKCGHAVPLNDEICAIRKELGLEEYPPTIIRHPDEIEKFRVLLFQLNSTDNINSEDQ